MALKDKLAKIRKELGPLPGATKVASASKERTLLSPAILKLAACLREQTGCPKITYEDLELVK